MLKLKNVSTKEKKPYLNNLNLQISKGEFVICNYLSSMEKDALIDLIARTNQSYKGEIIFNEKEISEFKRKPKDYHSKIGISFESLKLISSKSTLGNVTFPLEVHTKLPRKKIQEAGMKSLKVFGLLEKKDHFISKLSLEERQKVNIARSMILNPDLLILDNPEKYFAKKDMLNLLEFLEGLSKKGKAILIFSNDKNINMKKTIKKCLLKKGAISNV